MKRVWRFGLFILLANGCATTRPQPLTSGTIITMTQAGLTDSEIIRRIAESRSIFHLESAEVVRLRQAGVSERVVTEIIETDHRAAAAELRHAQIADEDWHQRFGLWPNGPGSR